MWMAKYKVCFTGFAYVEADSKEEAEALYYDGCEIYLDESVDLVMEVEDG